MDNEMVERGARVLFDHYDEHDATPLTMGEARELARQFIEALREPTEELKPYPAARELWSAIIDLLLAS